MLHVIPRTSISLTLALQARASRRLRDRVGHAQWETATPHAEHHRSRPHAESGSCEDVADKPAYRQVWHRAQLSSARNEKRMLGILPPERYLDWLDAPAEHSQDFMRAYPTQGLQVECNTT